jgi:hypothetical protein
MSVNWVVKIYKQNISSLLEFLWFDKKLILHSYLLHDHTYILYQHNDIFIYVTGPSNI